MSRPAVQLIIALLVLAFATTAGWMINGWRLKADTVDAQRAEAEALVRAMEAQNAQLAEAIGELQEFNAQTARDERATMDAVSQVQSDLRGVRDAIGESTVGPAGLSSDADELRQRAYHAATGAAPPTP